MAPGSRALKTVVLAGADTHDVRASDNEVLFTGAGGIQNTAGTTEADGCLRRGAVDTGQVDDERVGARRSLFEFRCAAMDADRRRSHSHRSAKRYSIHGSALPGASRQNIALNASGFSRLSRAYAERAVPHRTGWPQMTLPNANLRSERATGWETGFQANLPRWQSMLRVSYFWTQVNRPITALTLSTTPTATTAEARESRSDRESRRLGGLRGASMSNGWPLTGGYQYADATVTQLRSAAATRRQLDSAGGAQHGDDAGAAKPSADRNC